MQNDILWLRENPLSLLSRAVLHCTIAAPSRVKSGVSNLLVEHWNSLRGSVHPDEYICLLMHFRAWITNVYMYVNLTKRQSFS